MIQPVNVARNAIKRTKLNLPRYFPDTTQTRIKSLNPSRTKKLFRTHSKTSFNTRITAERENHTLPTKCSSEQPTKPKLVHLSHKPPMCMDPTWNTPSILNVPQWTRNQTPDLPIAIKPHP
ncbi:hypothetical protein M758_10G122000 [Ceratodon purpureus]|nr:hypothetical protein M758_10G122000 [Ceratodon purpureus]